MNNKGQSELVVAVAVIAGVLIVVLGLLGFHRQEVISCTVTDKERVVSAENSKYLVYCDQEVVQNTDELLAGKFNSADFQKDLKVGNTYQIRVCGYRIPVLSTFRNIIKIEK